MAITTQEALDALNITSDDLAALQKIGASFATLNAASVAAGGSGFSTSGMTQFFAIGVVFVQITGYERTVAAQRAQAIKDNQDAEDALQTDLTRISTLDAKEDITAEELVEKASLGAKVKRVRAEQTARTEAAETYAQSVAPIIEALNGRLLRLAAGDLSAV